MATDKAARVQAEAVLRGAGDGEFLPADALGDGFRILIYSHDSFGLGHLRRCRAIAHALVEHRSNLSVLILSGSPIIGSFDFRSRVDFVRVPGVIKLRNGEYTALNLHIGLQQTLAIRASIIRHTAEVFAPHLFLVDKEPLARRRRGRRGAGRLGAARLRTAPQHAAARRHRDRSLHATGETG